MPSPQEDDEGSCGMPHTGGYYGFCGAKSTEEWQAVGIAPLQSCRRAEHARRNGTATGASYSYGKDHERDALAVEPALDREDGVVVEQV